MYSIRPREEKRRWGINEKDNFKKHRHLGGIDHEQVGDEDDEMGDEGEVVVKCGRMVGKESMDRKCFHFTVKY